MKAIDRLYQYIENKGYKPTVFEKNIGLSSGYLSVQRKRSANIGDSIINKVLDYCHDLNPTWLISGKGSMLIDELNDSSHLNEPTTEYEVLTKDIGIPLIPISALAGAFNGEMSVLEYECERFVIPTFKGADFLISVKGSSMFPRYSSGDIVACKKLPIDTFFQWGKVYVLDTDQGPLIKKIKKGSNPDSLLISSENAEFEPFELNRSAVYHIALVLGVIRLE